MEAKDLANDTFFYEKLKASIPKLKDGEKDDVEVIKNVKSPESFADDDDDGKSDEENEENDEEEESDEESDESSESDGEEKNQGEKSSLISDEPVPKKDIEFVQDPDKTLKEVEKAFQNNNKYIENQQERANNGDDGDDSTEEEYKEKKPIFKTKHFSKDFQSAGELLKEVHSLIDKKKSEPDSGNHHWKLEYQNPTV